MMAPGLHGFALGCCYGRLWRGHRTARKYPPRLKSAAEKLRIHSPVLIRPQLTAIVNVINEPSPGSYLSSMILYLPLVDNVGNEDTGAFPSPALAGPIRDLAALRLPSAATLIRTRHQRCDLAIHTSGAGQGQITGYKDRSGSEPTLPGSTARARP